MLKKKVSILVLSLIALIIIGAILDHKTHFVGKTFNSVITDNINHYLSCEQLPTVGEVNKTIQVHKDVVEKVIKEIGSRYHDGDIKVIWEDGGNGSGRAIDDGSYFSSSWGESPLCQNTGKGDILFSYNSHSDREIIEKTFGADFFGIPYRGENH